MSGPDDVFAALADPTRRRVLDEIGRRGGATATELAADLPVTRQAVAKHLGVLADAGLVGARRTGRETRYRLTPQPLSEAIDWMTQVGAEWDERLARLQRLTAKRRDGRGAGAPERPAPRARRTTGSRDERGHDAAGR